MFRIPWDPSSGSTEPYLTEITRYGSQGKSRSFVILLFYHEVGNFGIILHKFNTPFFYITVQKLRCKTPT